MIPHKMVENMVERVEREVEDLNTESSVMEAEVILERLSITTILMSLKSNQI